MFAFSLLCVILVKIIYERVIKLPRPKADKSAVTGKHQQILDFIEKQSSEKGYPPSVREICAAIGFKSTSSVHSYLKALENKGLLLKDASKTRALKVTSGNKTDNSFVGTQDFNNNVVNIPIVGRVAAGEPILATENVEDTFPVPNDFLKNNESFMLKVKGESMIEAGILDGDFILVSKQQTANNGEIVVALIEDEATVKTFYKENGYIRLQPENSTMEPIIVKDNMSILGKVCGVFRKM